MAKVGAHVFKQHNVSYTDVGARRPYGLEACALTKSELSSLDFTVNRFFMKLFRTGNIEVVKNCQVYFEFSLPSVIWAERVKKFEAKYVTCDRTFTHYGHCMDY